MNNNLPSITISELTQIIKCQLNEENYRPIFALGKGGIGKTESICELSRELGLGYIDVRLLLYTESDLKGIPYPNSDHTRTIWLQNNILPTKERDGDRGILVFDEITSCARSVRTAAYQLLNERKLGEYTLPDGWLIVALGNGEEDGGDYQGMEGNFANRCSVFQVIPDPETWLEWADQPHGRNQEPVNELVRAYIRFRNSALHTFDPESENNLLFASPRSWTAVSNILNHMKRNDPDYYNNLFLQNESCSEKDKLLRLRIEGAIGSNNAPDFFNACRSRKDLIDFMDIIDGKSTGYEHRKYNLFTLSVLADSIRNHIQPEIIKGMGPDKNEADKVPQEVCAKVINVLTWISKMENLEQMTMLYKFFMEPKDLMTNFVINNETVFHFMNDCEQLQQLINSPVFTFDLSDDDFELVAPCSTMDESLPFD